MKKILLTLSILFALFMQITPAEASTISVHGYLKRNGTYVAPYHKTSSNGYKFDNWSAKGNINPFTGKKGYKVYLY